MARNAADNDLIDKMRRLEERIRKLEVREPPPHVRTFLISGEITEGMVIPRAFLGAYASWTATYLKLNDGECNVLVSLQNELSVTQVSYYLAASETAVRYEVDPPEQTEAEWQILVEVDSPDPLTNTLSVGIELTRPV